MTLHTISIRTAGPDDAEVLAPLFTTFNEQVGIMGLPTGADKGEAAQVTVSQMRRRLQALAGQETVYLAMDGDTIAGLAALRLVQHLDQDVPYAELTQLFVVPGYRRTGVASLLVATVEQAAKAGGSTALYLITDVNNHGAQAFYRQAGFAANYLCFEKVLE